MENLGRHSPENGLYHLKHALVKAAPHQWDDPLLNPYRGAVGSQELKELTGLMKACAINYLSGAPGEVRTQIKKRLPDFGALSNDSMAVTVAIPVADAERPEVNALYQRILYEAWGLADNLSGHPKIH
ncbi:MAG: hypothetical protein JW943_02675 [Deltaproteobacteria bacterium]|nr:hypothetical protein [Deltaproteobacteria bacterium]